MEEYKGYQIHTSIKKKGSYGKAVRGTSKTVSIQVRDYRGWEGNYLLKKQIQYPVNNKEKEQEAIEKAKKWIDEKGI